MRHKSPVRIGLVIGQLTRGGAEGQLAQLAVRLDRVRFEPRVYVLSNACEPWGPWIEHRHIPCTTIAGPSLKRVRRLARAFARDRIDLVHSWLYVANPLAAVAARLTRTPLITAARNCKVHGRLSQLANGVAFRMSRQIVANSADVAEFIVRSYGAPRERISIVPNGIDTDKFRPHPERSLERPLIVTAGRLVEQKNHALFLRAARVLRERLPHAWFAIAGEGPLRAELEGLAFSLGLQGVVEFLGERDDLEFVLPRAHVFWLTSRWEGMPNVLLEAMACGLPVVATDVGGCRELLGGSPAGVVVPPDSVADFVENTVRWLLSDEAFSAAAREARRRAEEFGMERMVARMENLYHQVLER